MRTLLLYVLYMFAGTAVVGVVVGMTLTVLLLIGTCMTAVCVAMTVIYRKKKVYQMSLTYRPSIGIAMLNTYVSVLS